MTHLVAALLGGLVAAVAGARVLLARRAEDSYRGRCPSGPDGVARGAEPIRRPAHGGRALLLLHGSGDSPQAFRYLAERLEGAGVGVYAPLLPGHGRSPRDFRRVSADAYREAARAALQETRHMADWVGVVGLSMGGALGADLAAEDPDVRVLILLAPYVSPPPAVRWAARLSWVWSVVVPYLDARGGASVHDPAMAPLSRAYGVFPARALRALVTTAERGRRALGRVSAPLLVVNSEEDNRIPRAEAEEGIRALPPHAEHVWVRGCGHVVTVDYCKEAVAELVLAFLARQPD